jgi:hypothetical protein
MKIGVLALICGGFVFGFAFITVLMGVGLQPCSTKIPRSRERARAAGGFVTLE